MEPWGILTFKAQIQDEKEKENQEDNQKSALYGDLATEANRKE